jgi:hypothetical protein
MRVLLLVALLVGASSVCAVADTAAADDALAAPRSIIVTGTLEIGPECPALRSDGGVLYSLLIPNQGQFSYGKHVRIEGHLAAVSICSNGSAIFVDHMESVAVPDLRLNQ